MFLYLCLNEIQLAISDLIPQKFLKICKICSTLTIFEFCRTISIRDDSRFFLITIKCNFSIIICGEILFWKVQSVLIFLILPSYHHLIFVLIIDKFWIPPWIFQLVISPLCISFSGIFKLVTTQPAAASRRVSLAASARRLLDRSVWLASLRWHS